MSASIQTDEFYRNHEPGAAATHRKNKDRRQRPRLEWYQKLAPKDPVHMVTVKIANSIQRTLKKYNMDLAFSAVEFNTDLAFSAVDLNTDGPILTFASAHYGPDAEKWLRACWEKVVRLCEHGNAICLVV